VHLSWQFWAVMSAVFAALTAIFAKVGVASVNSDFATFIRTVVILGCLAAFLFATDQYQSPGSISTRTYVFLVLSGLATGASWVCYFRALKVRRGEGRAHRQAQRRAGRDLRGGLPRRTAVARGLARHLADCGGRSADRERIIGDCSRTDGSCIVKSKSAAFRKSGVTAAKVRHACAD
jgi:uncharacterized membrane protein